MRRLAGTVLIVLLAASLLGGWMILRARPWRPDAGACAVRSFEGSNFTVCVYRRNTDSLQIALDGPAGALGDFASLKTKLGDEARDVRFAMNGGMYDAAQRPVGLLIQAGATSHPPQLSTGSGNFFLLPNGVFYVDRNGAAHVEETHIFMTHPDQAVWATQSGPLLLSGGTPHPAITANGASTFIRNGVCVAGPDIAWFVISNEKVSFGRLMRFFQQALGCRDALYLDGAVSSLWAPSLGRQDGRKGLGPLVVVSRKAARS